jgi:hypothetical protein
VRDLFTTTELKPFLFPRGDRLITSIALSKALRRAGFRQRVVRTENGAQKLWAGRNLTKWARATNAEWGAHFDKHRRKTKFKK